MTSAVPWIGSSGGNAPIFDLPNISSIVPSRASGSSTPTFTRASTSYQTDFEGKSNLCLSGEARFQGARRIGNIVNATSTANPSGASYTKDGVTVSTNTVTATAGTANHWVYAGGTGSVSGLYNYQCRAKAGTVSWMGLSRGGGAASVGAFFNLSTGAVGTINGAGVTAAISSTTDSEGYYLCSINVPNAIPAFVAVEPHTSDNQALSWTAAGTETILVKDFQITSKIGVTNVNPDEYVSVGVLSAPYHGANVDGVKYFTTLNGNTVASNVVTEATGAAINSSQGACAGGVTAGVVTATRPLGYLSEPAATNLCLQSQDFATTWAVTVADTDITTNVAVAPDGTTTADKIREKATTAAHNATQSIAIANATVYTISGYVKAAERTWALFNLYDGTTHHGTWVNLSTGALGTSFGTISNSTATLRSDGWVFVTVTFTSTNTSGIFGFYASTGDTVSSYLGTATNGIYAWGAQLETGSVATSYIPTTTVSVTRAADQLTYAVAGNVNNAQGSCYAEVFTSWSTDYGSGAGSQMVGAFGNIAFLRTLNGSAATTITIFDGTNAPEKTGLSSTATAVRKRMSAWSVAGGLLVTGDGAAPATGSFDGSMDATSISIGAKSDGTASLNGCIANVRIYGKALSAAQLQAMTT